MRCILWTALLFLPALVLVNTPSTLLRAEDDQLSKKDAVELVNSYFLDEKADREVILEKLSGASGELLGKEKDVKFWTKTAFDALREQTIRKYEKLYPDFRRKGFNGTLTCAHPEHKGQYWLVGNPTARNTGVIFTLHGGGEKSANDSAWPGMRGQYTTPRCVSICPRVLTDGGEGWNTPDCLVYLETIVRDLCALYDVDTNRIYCTGYSLGGAGTFYYGTVYADRFAAIAPNANGDTLTCSYENLYHTPMQIHIGDQDTIGDRIGRCRTVRDKMEKLREAYPDGYVLNYIEHAGAGHGVPTEDVPKWLNQYTRDPNPKKIIWKPLDDRVDKTTFYWVESPYPAMCRLELEREGNTVTVKQNEMGDVTLYFNDDTIDFDQPVRVVQGDKELAAAPLVRDLGVLVKTVDLHADPHRVYTAKLTFKRADD